MTKKNILPLALLFAMLTLASIPLQAQPPPPPGSSPDPIDQGLMMLLIPIIMYGYYSLKNRELSGAETL